MRLSTMMTGGLVLLAAILLTIGIIAIASLHEAADEIVRMEKALLAATARDPGAGGPAAEDVARSRGAAALVAMATGVAFLVLLVMGSRIQSGIVSPVTRLVREAQAIASGRLNRRVSAGEGFQEIRILGEAVNRLADLLIEGGASRFPDHLVCRAAIEMLLDEQGVAGGLVTPSGDLLASNEALRTLLFHGGGDVKSTIGVAGDSWLSYAVDRRDVCERGAVRGQLLRVRVPPEPFARGEQAGSRL